MPREHLSKPAALAHVALVARHARFPSTRDWKRLIDAFESLDLSPDEMKISATALGLLTEDAQPKSSDITSDDIPWELTFSESTKARVRVAVERQGFHEFHTGGGCMAWEKSIGPDDDPAAARPYIYITAWDAEIWGTPERKDWSVGRYTRDNDTVECAEGLTLATALQVAEEYEARILTEIELERAQ